MEQATIIGVDLAKHVFQLHGACADGSVVFRKKISRAKFLPFLASQPRCVVAMEACAGAHGWARDIQAQGHEVRLIAPAYVKPFVKRQKNDMADAEAITEAAARPTMRFVAVKSAEKQASGMVFKTRDLLVRQRTQTINALRGHLTEHGIIAPQGVFHVGRLAAEVENVAPSAERCYRAVHIAAPAHRLARRADRGARPTCSRPRPRGSNSAAPDEHSWCRPGLRDGAGGAGTAARDLCQRTRLRGLARSHSTTEFLRWQSAARAYLADGAARPEAAADHRRDGCGAVGRQAGRSCRIVACPDDGEKTAHACGNRACEQDRPDRLGSDGERRGLPKFGCARVTAEAAGAVSGCGGVNGGLWANGHEDGVGKTSSPDGAS